MSANSKAGHVHVLLHLPPRLKERLASRSRETGKTQKALYHTAIEVFARRQSDRRRVRPLRYSPLYGGDDAVPLRLWIKQPLIETVMTLAEGHHIRRREVIYTALWSALLGD